MNSIIWGVKYVSTNLKKFRFIVSCILQKFVKSFLYRSTHTNVIFIRAKNSEQIWCPIVREQLVGNYGYIHLIDYHAGSKNHGDSHLTLENVQVAKCKM